MKGGPGNADKPFVWLKLEAITNFEDPEKVKSLTPLLYGFMEDELKLEKVIIVFRIGQATKTPTGWI